MAKIHYLNEGVFRKIAAGEVIERPMSAVKELVENAIDAGADSIMVELKAGGKELIRVEDNGSGFSAAEIEIAFQRHTTSKLNELEDLDHLQTLGFRGEALPSILEVADIDLLSADNDNGHGWHCLFRNGRLQDKKECACTRGTTIAVCGLFADFPVRRKFMKSDQGELRPITAFLEVTALARPAIAFSLRHNGRSVFTFPAAADLKARVYQVFGNDFLADLRAVDFSSGDYSLNGFISAAQTGISGKGRQFFIVNGRPVKEKTMVAAFNNTFQNYLEKSRSPAGILNISIPPGHIDVNIHPMKLEIRFLDSSRIYQFIKNAIDQTMGQPARPANVNAVAFPKDLSTVPVTGEKAASRAGDLTFNEPLSHTEDDFQVLGQYRNSYIVVEKNGELLIIDQHNARERVLFERLKAGYQAGSVVSAQALFPLLLELSPAERMALDEEKNAFFKKCGFDIRLLSGAAIEIKAFPQFLAEAEIKETVRAALQQSGDDLPAEERLLAAMACRNAVKVNQRLQPEQQRALVKDLFACASPYLCPHRRPIIVTLTLADIEKYLKRR
ncbi:MAG: DNA mismatch repair endonuclease MutL [Candidatus Aminicenantes bacterium]|nr:DNA mismatch repair endonuclease MutL [Candidatus Aminicenantes bacterium]